MLIELIKYNLKIDINGRIITYIISIFRKIYEMSPFETRQSIIQISLWEKYRYIWLTEVIENPLKLTYKIFSIISTCSYTIFALTIIFC